MRKTIRKVFLGIGVIGLFVWYSVYKYMLRAECTEAGTILEDCAFVLPWDLSFQQATMMVIVPGFVATIPFLLAFLVGGELPPRPAPDKTTTDKDEE